LTEAINLAEYIAAEQTYFTHISHYLGLHETVSQALPDSVALAVDGMEIWV
jgi:phosphoribosyl 1,2-cyclic phosphate phosphodiesterase